MTGIAPPAAAPRRSPWRAVAIAVTAVAWIAAGVVGLSRYVANYQRYRGFPPPAHTANVPQGKLLTAAYFSPALQRDASAVVYLPPGYAAAAAAGRRFPVLYLLHAPPGSPTGYLTIGDLVVRMDDLIHSGAIRPFLVAIPDGHTAAYGNDTEWANAQAGRYESFVLDTVHALDHRFATVRSRTGRALAGLSEGGYGAANVTLHHLRAFGTFESWSGYFEQTRTQSFDRATPAQLAANSPREYVSSMAAGLHRLPTYAFLYRGTSDRLTSASDTQRFAARLRAAGGHVTTSTYTGGHNWRLWRLRMPSMLEFASSHFAGPRSKGAAG